MKTLARTLTTIGQFILNKLIAIISLVALMLLYLNMPTNVPIPFAELLYVAILILGTSLMALLVRLLVWPEVAAYAEGKQLGYDLQNIDTSNALKHYWYATGLSFLISIACFATLSH